MSFELFASRRGGLLRTVLCESGEAVEVRVESDEQPFRVGQVYKGRIVAVEPALDAAFVDLGSAQSGLLRFQDRGESRDLQPGAEVVVQIAREPSIRKGPRVTGRVAIGGRRLVLLAADPFRGISRRVVDPVEASRLRALLDALPGPNGWIVRANASGSTPGEIAGEAEVLSTTWMEIEVVASRTAAPALLRQAPDLLERMLLDAPDLDRLVTDDAGDAQRVRSRVTRIELWSQPRPLFSALGLDQVVERACAREVRLRSGGRLVIESTEACVAIDVDSGRSSTANGSAALVSQTNREAAIEIAKQLRLRDLGGRVVVDFLAMESPNARESLLATFGAALAQDPSRTRVASIEGASLVALTREHPRASVDERLTECCPGCSGTGRVTTARVAATRARDALANSLAVSGPRPMRIRAHPAVARHLAGTIDPALPVAIEHDATLAPGTYVLAPERD